MLTNNINFKNFSFNKSNKKILYLFKDLIKENNEVLNSLKKTYKDSYTKKTVYRLKKFTEIILIGMGGSVLGSRSIYSFLKSRIKKKFYFIDNFDEVKTISKKNKKKQLNLIVSKSGNTLETISISNILINNTRKNIFITENKKSYLMDLAKKLKSEIIHHNNYIGGRYSVLSEVGMLPAELMGFKPNKFRRLNFLVKNKRFVNALIRNVSNTLYLIKRKNLIL